MDWKIKRLEDLTIGELYKILRVRSEVFVVEQQCVYQDCDSKDKSAYHLFLESGQGIAAYLRILDKGVSYTEISIGRVLVSKEYRGKGFAKEMMAKAISFIEDNLKGQEIRISAQSYLKDFYSSFGFREVSEEYLEDNIPHIEMLYKNFEQQV